MTQTLPACCRPASLRGIAHLARLPGPLPWQLAPWFGTDPLLDAARAHRAMQRLFPGRPPAHYRQWLSRHCAMRSRELVDAHAFSRVLAQKGVRIEVVGFDREWLKTESAPGTLLLMTHLDRFLTAPLVLAAQGVALHMLTMPADTLALPPDYRRFLLNKIAAFQQVIAGRWLTTRQPLTAMIKGLQRGQWWIALPDAWEPTFASFARFSFLGGTIAFPAGLLRIAQKTRCRLLYAETEEMAPHRLRVSFTMLDRPAHDAFAWIADRLATVLTTAPWRWWQWPLLDPLWHP